MLHNSGFIVSFILASMLTVLSAKSKKHMLLVVSFDGFKPDYLNMPEVKMENMHLFSKQGVFSPSGMIPCFTSKTFPNHFSIATGLYEESHGIINNKMYNPLKKPILFNKNANATDWWDNGLNLPLWTLNEKNGGSSAVIMWPGGPASFQGTNITYNVPYENKMSWTKKVNLTINFLTKKDNPANVVFLYFKEPDFTSHYFGPFSNQTLNKLKDIDNIVGYMIKMIKSADLQDDLNMIILSDHGMQTVPKRNQIQFNDIISPDLVHFSETGPVIQIYPLEGKYDEVYGILTESCKKYNLTVYKKEEIPDAFHYKNNDNVADFVVFAPIGYLIITYNDTQPQPNRGTHGYNNSATSMRAFFMAKGPAFKQQFVVKEPFQNIHLYALMSHILGLQPGPNNGSFDAVSFMLKDELKSFCCSKENVDNIILIVLSVTCAVLFAVSFVAVYRQYYHKKKKNYSMIVSGEDLENDF